MFNVVRGDADAAIKSNSAYLTIHGLAAGDRTICDKYNRFPEFWTLNTFALQTTFFIASGRLFDARRDSYSIHKLVEATIANPAFFSKAALRERKRQASGITGADPQWLLDYLNEAWEPTTADLQPFRTALAPHTRKFAAIYQPIRHKVYAHRSIEDAMAITALFDKTVISDVAEILRFLHSLLCAIREMAWNARRPDLTDFADYEAFVTSLNRKTEGFIRQLP